MVVGVGEMDGGGGHTYRRLQIVPRGGRIIDCNADGLHSSDVDRGPTLESCHFRSMMDDQLNVQVRLRLLKN